MKTHFHSGAEVTKLSDDGGSGSDHAIIGRTTATAPKDKRRSEGTFETERDLEVLLQMHRRVEANKKVAMRRMEKMVVTAL